jgi:3-deoxy-D-manno-octulosonate 8-phosphate phosphatase (KDO 8-P phosphatase)
MKNYKELLNHIDTFIFDVDGVFTDGIVYLMAGGEQIRTANVRDGYAVQLAIKKGYKIAIITGGDSEEVRTRFNGLGVTDVFLSSSDKVKVFRDYCEKHNLKSEQICYMGDDIPDWKVMHEVGLAACPADAAPEIKSFCQYISPKNGGHGCVRDIIEQTMRVQGKWFGDDAHHW